MKLFKKKNEFDMPLLVTDIGPSWFRYEPRT